MQQIRQFFFLPLILLSFFFLGCQVEQESSNDSSGETSTLQTLSLAVQINTPNTNSSKRGIDSFFRKKSDFSIVDQVTVEVKEGNSTVIPPTNMIKSNGVWNLTLDGLLLNRSYSFIAIAYEGGTETFNGSVNQSFITGTGNTVNIELNSSEEVYLLFPKITQILRPTQMIAETNSSIQISVEGSTNEMLSYEFKKDSTADLGTFTPESGDVTLVGSSTTIVSNYTAPIDEGTYNFSTKIANAKNNSVEAIFQITVDQVSSDVTIQVNPVVGGMNIKCGADQLTWTATAIGYNGTASELSYQWSFDGTGDAFQNSTQNGAILPNYNANTVGAVTLTVTDTNANGGKTIVTYQLESGFCPVIQETATISEFQEFQSIDTIGAVDWESFKIGADTYLAVANYNNGSTQNLPSKIYKWNGTIFEEFQSINTYGAYGWKSFQIGADNYLVVANHHNGSSYNIASKIYKWNGTIFEEFQSINTNGATEWKSFQIGDSYYLAVANLGNGSTRNIPSKIYKWNGTIFEEFQSINTNEARGWAAFEIGADNYLAVANHRNGSYSIPSKIYKWNGTIFEEFQSINTNGALDWKSFQIGSNYYLAVANFYNDSTRNIPSKIYKWNGTIFEEFQSINTNGAVDWHSFQIGSEMYLAVANYYNDSTYNIPSKIYKWNGTIFEEFQSINTHGAHDWHPFQIGASTYFAVANYENGSTHNIASKIYKAVFE